MQGADQLSADTATLSPRKAGLALGVLLDDPVPGLRHPGGSGSVPGKNSRARAQLCRARFTREASGGGGKAVSRRISGGFCRL